MRTKTLLLTAAAMLAAGIVTSQAQSPVYSQNIVGYATITAPSAYTLMTVPFQLSPNNSATNVFGSALPDTTLLLIWNASTGKFVTYVYDTGGGYNTPPYWFMSDDSTPTNPPTLDPGQGFFLQAPGGVTNTFAGVVPVNVGATNTQTLGSFYSLIGSVIPAAGSVTNSILSFSGGLGTLPDTTLVLIYNSTSGKYVTYVYDTGAGYNNPPYWFMSDDSTPTNPPSLTVGQGFFIQPPGGGTWSQVLPSN